MCFRQHATVHIFTTITIQYTNKNKLHPESEKKLQFLFTIRNLNYKTKKQGANCPNKLTKSINTANI